MTGRTADCDRYGASGCNDCQLQYGDRIRAGAEEQVLRRRGTVQHCGDRTGTCMAPDDADQQRRRGTETIYADRRQRLIQRRDPDIKEYGQEQSDHTLCSFFRFRYMQHTILLQN